MRGGEVQCHYITFFLEGVRGWKTDDLLLVSVTVKFPHPTPKIQGVYRTGKGHSNTVNM